ncbi:MAG: hypothetical protein B7X39_18335 [Lysobacterales bacterium 14-68-21]|jgi:hypothetical protein|nr:MAG: hypothetical protein B7X45_16555 [Xanthomonadales bacterium 15-68-25]OZB63784.1 MAG: hypothetical protein B7X39_18335 [Xanthomonadales bacterium 14-68-21]
MKVALPIVLAGCLALGSAAVHADSRSLNSFPDHVLPVLVQVDSHGKVTDVSPAVELSPRYDRLLRETLDRMVTRPASYRGRPVASQFVMKLGMQAKLREDGRYDASFFYVSAQPVPAGRWFWQHEDGHRLTLVNRDELRPQAWRRSPDGGWRTPPPMPRFMRNSPPPTPAAAGVPSGAGGKP